MNNNVKIAKELIKLAKCLVADENGQKFYDFYDLQSFLDDNGWCFYNSYDVESGDESGTRFELVEYPQNIRHITPISKEEMKKKLGELEKNYSNVKQSIGTNRNAPEQKRLSIIILNI